MVERTEKRPAHSLNGTPFEPWNDDELATLLEELLTRTLCERPQDLDSARARIQAWRGAHDLVGELERRGLLRGAR
jgi:hypothetical protein